MPSIQIATDKNDFLSGNFFSFFFEFINKILCLDHQKIQKKDREIKKRESLLRKKNFLETYSDLSNSVKKKPRSPSKYSDFHSPHKDFSQENFEINEIKKN